MKKKILLSLVLATLLFLSACNFTGVRKSTKESSKTASTESSSEMFSDRDMETGYDEETSARIMLSNSGTSSNSNAVQISGSTVTITEEGTYILSGTLDDGMIVGWDTKVRKLREWDTSMQISKAWFRGRLAVCLPAC